MPPRVCPRVQRVLYRPRPCAVGVVTSLELQNGVPRPSADISTPACSRNKLQNRHAPCGSQNHSPNSPEALQPRAPALPSDPGLANVALAPLRTGQEQLALPGTASPTGQVSSCTSFGAQLQAPPAWQGCLNAEPEHGPLPHAGTSLRGRHSICWGAGVIMYPEKASPGGGVNPTGPRADRRCPPLGVPLSWQSPPLIKYFFHLVTTVPIKEDGEKQFLP